MLKASASRLNLKYTNLSVPGGKNSRLCSVLYLQAKTPFDGQFLMLFRENTRTGNDCRFGDVRRSDPILERPVTVYTFDNRLYRW